MAKLGKDKIALFLACASIFGGNTRAAQDVKTGQTIGAVGGRLLIANRIQVLELKILLVIKSLEPKKN